MNIIRDNATPDESSMWCSIDWKEIEDYVRGMQIKIAEATKAGKWREVERLQFLLTHSFRAKLLAVKKVTSNKGKRTSGVDGVLWITDASKWKGAQSLNQKDYKASPLKRVEIPKSNGGVRNLGIPTMRDRAMQCLYKFALEPVAEVLADKRSFGFRPKRCCQDAMEHIYKCMAKGSGAQWVLEGDIRKCFDTISHKWMLENIPIDKKVLKEWLKAGFISGDRLFPTEEGTPQGGVISPTLSNMVLDGIEKILAERFPRGKGHKVNLCRYADDFVVTGSSKEILEEAKELIKEFLAVRGLALSEEKTHISHINDGFDFLGFNFRKYNGKMLIKPSKKSVSKFLKGIKETIRAHNGSSQVDLILTLNPKINGWVNYFRFVVCAEIFQGVHHMIWEKLWHWAVRMHRHKPKRWIKNKYFRFWKGDNWRFMDEKAEVFLSNRLLSTKVVRWRMIQINAEVFNPEWDGYFQERDERDIVSEYFGVVE